jgi:hypothetical protein
MSKMPKVDAGPCLIRASEALARGETATHAMGVYNVPRIEYWQDRVYDLRCSLFIPAEREETQRKQAELDRMKAAEAAVGAASRLSSDEEKEVNRRLRLFGS